MELFQTINVNPPDLLTQANFYKYYFTMDESKADLILYFPILLK